MFINNVPSYVAPMYSYVTNLFPYNLYITLWVCMYLYVTRIYSYVTRMYVPICTGMLLVCTRPYSHVTRMYSYALVCTRMSLIYTRMFLLSTHNYSYVTRMYSSVLSCTRTLLVSTRLYSYGTRMFSCGVLVTIIAYCFNTHLDSHMGICVVAFQDHWRMTWKPFGPGSIIKRLVIEPDRTFRNRLISI